jgi:Na+/H+ antiporter NhaD/arsenite permease-like protein
MESTASSVVVLLFFTVAVLTVIFPLRVPIPKTSHSIVVNFASGPLACLIILAIITAVPFRLLLDALIGDAQIQPYTIIILFFSLAYVCISLDSTNIFSWIAVKVIQKAGHSGRRLFLAVFIFSSCLTLATSNDIVILTLTPIICNISKFAKCDPTPLLIAQFFAANIWSVSLIIGNPTNVIAGEAFGVTFLEYMKWMVAPAVGGGLCALLIMMLLFRHDLTFDMKDVVLEGDQYQLHAPRLAAVKCAVFGVCLLLFCISDFVSLKLWVICLSAGVFYLVLDVVLDVLKKHGGHDVREERWVTFANMKRLPFPVAPFMVGMFGLVYALEVTGWISMLARLLGGVCTSVTSTTLFVCFMTALACSLMNNQPMTILFSRVFLHQSFTSSALIRRSAMFSLIIGSNYGANFSYVAAMAGLMFQAILAHYNIFLSGKVFSIYGFITMTWVVLMSSLILLCELLILE